MKDEYRINPKNKINPYLSEETLTKHKKEFSAKINIVLDFAKKHPNFDDTEILKLKRQIDKYSTMDSKQYYELELLIEQIKNLNKLFKSNPRGKFGLADLEKLRKKEVWE